VFQASPTELTAFAVSPDGRSILTGDAAGKLQLLDLATGTPRETATILGAVTFLEWSQETDEEVSALAVTADGNVHMLAVSPIRELSPRKLDSAVETQAHFRPKTREILVSHGPGSLERWSYARLR
jgi:hypothetical protein